GSRNIAGSAVSTFLVRWPVHHCLALLTLVPLFCGSPTNRSLVRPGALVHVPGHRWRGWAPHPQILRPGRGCACSEVQARTSFRGLLGDRMYVPLPQDHVALTVQLDLTLLLGVEEHTITGLDVAGARDRKSTRLNSSHVSISYA